MLDRVLRRALVLACVLAAPAGAALGACAGDDTPDAPPEARDATPPWDDDSARISHCAFVDEPDVPPGPVTEAGAVRAGIGSRYLLLPIGVPMGGYGGRSTTIGGSATPLDTREGRWTTAFVPSVGMHDAPRVDAIALEVGGERLVLMRIDSAVMTENALFELEQAIAPDGSLRGRVIVSASHSHGAPAAWPPSLVLVPGLDRPLRELLDQAVATMAEAAKEALATLEPARIGFASSFSLDPDSELSHDRRGENDTVLGPDGNDAGKSKDPMVWAMRVDRSDGSPLSALLSVPMHGTIGEEPNPLMSSDATGAVERALSAELGFPVFHVQGAAGDVSPGGTTGRAACPDSAHCLDMPKMEVLGARAAARLSALVSDIDTYASAELEVVTHTFYVGKSRPVERPDGALLYYPPYVQNYFPDGRIFADDGKLLSPLDEFNVTAGAALCGSLGTTSFAPIDGTRDAGAYSSCADIGKIAATYAGLYDLPPIELPICDTLRTTTTAVRFSGAGDDVLLLTVPGEPTAPLTAYLRGRSPAGREHTFVVGYAQDYIGYVLTAEDWLAGGYEPSLNVWGPLEGEMIVDGILDAAERAWSPERDGVTAGSSRFESFPMPPVEPVGVTVTRDHGSVPTSVPNLFWPDTTQSITLPQPDAQLPRVVGAARFVWLGGDPAVDSPEVVVEHESAPGVFEPVLTSRGQEASSREGAVVLTYAPDPLDAAQPTRHVYAATWQAVPPDPYTFRDPGRPYALPLGRYRLSVRGWALADGGAEAYAVSSDPFEVVAAPLAVASATLVAGAIELQAELGAAPGLRALREGVSDSGVPLPGPWSVTVLLQNNQSHTVSVAPSQEGKATVAVPGIDLTRATSVEIRDPHGNGGVVPVTP